MRQEEGRAESLSGGKVLDYSSHMPNTRCYVMVISKNGQQIKVIFEPEQVILDGSGCLPKKSHLVRKKERVDIAIFFMYHIF